MRSALVSLSDVQPPEVNISHIWNGPINIVYIAFTLIDLMDHLNLLDSTVQ